MSGSDQFSYLDSSSLVCSFMVAAPPDGALWVESAAGHGDLVLRVDGDADLATAAVLGQALAGASHSSQRRVVLDLAGLRFIDAHCLGVIGNAHCLLCEQGRVLVLRSPPPLVRRLLAICEMDPFIEA